MLTINQKYNLLIESLYHSVGNRCLIDKSFLQEINLTDIELENFLSTPSQNKGLVIGKSPTNGGYLMATLTDKGIAYFDNGYSLGQEHSIPTVQMNIQNLNNSGNIAGINQGGQCIDNHGTQIDQLIELLKKSGNPKKEDIIKVAEEYKISPSMELFGKLVGMTANTGAIGQILNTLFLSLS